MSIFKRLGKTNSKGFTLVELLVVIAIIGILATLVLLQLGVARAKARDAKRIADVSQIRTASELFFDDNGGTYPAGPLAPGVGGVPAPVPQTAGPCFCGNDLTQYISSTLLPVDPLTAAAYGYAQRNQTLAAPPANRTMYQVYAELERSAPAAFSADADIDATTWGAAPIGRVGVNGATEACTAAANDCVYDQGQRP